MEPTSPRGRATFGPPRNAFGAFGWAVVQLPRALWWQVRERELRALTLAPVLWTLIAGVTGLVGAVIAAGPLSAALIAEPAWLQLTLRVVLTFVLALLAVLLTWQLQGALAAPSLERMALFVQREVTGDAPPPESGALLAMKKALTGFFPSVRRLFAWALTAALGLTLVLVPVVGPVLVIVAQTAVAALFLAHGAIVQNRARLGLPRRFVLAEPALVLGLAVSCVPLVLVPPLLLFVGSTVHVAGALVSLGWQRRSALVVGVTQDQH